MSADFRVPQTLSDRKLLAESKPSHLQDKENKAEDPPAKLEAIFLSHFQIIARRKVESPNRHWNRKVS